MSGFLAAKATARSPRVSPKNTQPCLLAVSLGAWGPRGAESHHQPQPVTGALPRPAPAYCQTEGREHHKDTQNVSRCHPCYVTQPTSRPHRASASFNCWKFKIGDLLFLRAKESGSFQLRKASTGTHKPAHGVLQTESVTPCCSACGGVSSHPPRVGLVTCAPMQHTQRWAVCLIC